jgi:hypothetical protein
MLKKNFNKIFSWYEHYGIDNFGTHMNKLFVFVCWVVYCQICIPLLDIVCYLTWPLPTSFCLAVTLMKIIGNSMILLLFDAILITKYALIFWLKNPGVINDEFWCRFINYWVIMANTLYDTTRYQKLSNHFLGHLQWD